MPGRGAALEDLDDDHATAAAWTRAREDGRLVAIIIIIGGLGLGLLATEQLVGACDIVSTGGAGEQAVVADAVEALGQDVDQEAADELVGRQRHGRVPTWSLDPVILPLERNVGIVGWDQPAVGDGDAMGV